MTAYIIEHKGIELIKYAEVIFGGWAGYYIKIINKGHKNSFLSYNGLSPYVVYFVSEQIAKDFLTSWIDKQHHKKETRISDLQKSTELKSGDACIREKTAQIVKNIRQAYNEGILIPSDDIASHKDIQTSIANIVTKKPLETSDRSDTESVIQRLSADKPIILGIDWGAGVEESFNHERLIDYDLDEF